MAVYTQLSGTEIQLLADRLGLGRVVAVHGVAAGVENSTYFLSIANPLTAAGSPSIASSGTVSNAPDEFVLTIAETLSKSDLCFVAEITSYLSVQQLPVPAPLVDHSGNKVFMLAGKPAIMVPRIDGSHPIQPSAMQCDVIGQTLARLHLATLASNLVHKSHRSLSWVIATGARLLAHLTPEERQLLQEELALLNRFISTRKILPQAIIHGDLFIDNTLFLQDKLTGVIDFFSAGTGYLLLDLAIVANDWCRARSACFSAPHLRALTGSYANARNPIPAEIELWPYFLRIAALRFWVSRLAEAHIGDAVRPPGSGKDPNEYRDLLIWHRDAPTHWSAY